MIWYVPLILSVVLLLSAALVFSQSQVIAVFTAACGLFVLFISPFSRKVCRIELTETRVTVYGLLGNIERVIEKGDVLRVDFPIGVEDLLWIRTKQGEYCVPNHIKGHKQVIEIMSRWARENSNLEF